MKYQDRINFYIVNRSTEDSIKDIYSPLANDFALIINENFYFSFIEEINNGGLFFDQSLQFYSFTEERDYRNISVVNEALKREYKELFNGLVAFAQDVFGNQFAFNTLENCVVLFNIETAEQKNVAQSFEDWLIILETDLDYFAGVSYARKWKEHNELGLDQRILPEVPFVIGGEYNLENFDISTFPYYISYNAQLAKQIFNLKDGESIELVIKKKQ